MIRYPSSIVFLHWLSALLLVVMLFASDLMPILPHMVMGSLIAVVFISRLMIRAKSKLPKDINQSNRFLELAGKLTHWALYLVVIVTAASGLAIAIEADLFSVVLSGLPFPEGVDKLLSRSIHDLFEHALKAIVLLHIGAAVFHQFILKDRVFKRMWWAS